jgi:hypothetical protein
MTLILTKQPKSSFFDRNCNAQWQGRDECVKGHSDGVAGLQDALPVLDEDEASLRRPVRAKTSLAQARNLDIPLSFFFARRTYSTLLLGSFFVCISCTALLLFNYVRPYAPITSSFGIEANYVQSKMSSKSRQRLPQEQIQGRSLYPPALVVQTCQCHSLMPFSSSLCVESH